MCELSHNGTTYTWWLHEPDMITVRAPDGRKKTTQVGGSPPEVLAMRLAGDLERDLTNNFPAVYGRSPEARDER